MGKMISKELVRIAAAAMLVALVSSGCAATRDRAGAAAAGGFLVDYSQLGRKNDYPAALVYLKPGAQWVTYRAITLDYAGLWLGDESAKVSGTDRLMLADMLYTSLHDALARSFSLVDRPGPDTLRVRVALTQTSGTNVQERAATKALPQLRLAAATDRLASSTSEAMGSSRIEMEVLDAATNERLAAAVDEQSGSKVFFPRHAYHTWGDVEAACDYWSKRIVWRLAEAGVQLRPDAKTPENPS